MSILRDFTFHSGRELFLRVGSPPVCPGPTAYAAPTFGTTYLPPASLATTYPAAWPPTGFPGFSQPVAAFGLRVLRGANPHP